MERSVQVKRLDAPDGEWRFRDGSTRVAVGFDGGVAIGSGVYQPGWRWSAHAKQHESSAEHIGYVVRGRMAVEGADGTLVEVGPGEAFRAAPGHDAWVVGDEPCTALDFALG
jgi:Cupin domain